MSEPFSTSLIESSRVGSSPLDWPRVDTRLAHHYGLFSFLRMLLCKDDKQELTELTSLFSTLHNLNVSHSDFEPLIFYRPGSGEKSPFSRAQIDLCGQKCHRANVSLIVQLQAATPISLKASSNGQDQLIHPSLLSFHCDRDSYSMVSKRRICGKFSSIPTAVEFNSFSIFCLRGHAIRIWNVENTFR